MAGYTQNDNLVTCNNFMMLRNKLTVVNFAKMSVVILSTFIEFLKKY